MIGSASSRTNSASMSLSLMSNQSQSQKADVEASGLASTASGSHALVNGFTHWLQKTFLKSSLFMYRPILNMSSFHSMSGDWVSIQSSGKKLSLSIFVFAEGCTYADSLWNRIIIKKTSMDVSRLTVSKVTAVRVPGDVLMLHVHQTNDQRDIYLVILEPSLASPNY